MDTFPPTFFLKPGYPLQRLHRELEQRPQHPVLLAVPCTWTSAKGHGSLSSANILQLILQPSAVGTYVAYEMPGSVLSLVLRMRKVGLRPVRDYLRSQLVTWERPHLSPPPLELGWKGKEKQKTILKRCLVSE